VPDVLLEARDVTVRFGGVVALDRASVAVEERQIVGVIGPNGAGKSTLMNAVSGFVKVRDGDVFIGGKSVTRLQPHRRARSGLGRTFQVPRLYRGLTVAENVAVVQTESRRVGVASADAMELCGVSGLADTPVERLDAGQQRFVEIARTLAMAPTVMLLDEPATGLRDDEVHQLGELLLRARNDLGIASMVISHDMRVIHHCCDSVTMLEFGRVMVTGTAAAVCSDPKVIAAYLGNEVTA
jgi:ABC-type branched-subunit amino acid transport system ATPase component